MLVHSLSTGLQVFDEFARDRFQSVICSTYYLTPERIELFWDGKIVVQSVFFAHVVTYGSNLEAGGSSKR